MSKKATAPRIAEQSAKFYSEVFPSLNAGMEYVGDAFPLLYKRTLLSLKNIFSRAELCLLIDIFNGTFLTPNLAGQHLEIQVEDGIKLEGLDEKWEVDSEKLLGKIQSLKFFERVCLEIWAKGFWNKNQNMDEWLKSLCDQSSSVT